jgi:hypothetical protein
MTRTIDKNQFPAITGNLYAVFNEFTALCELDCDADAEELMHCIRYWQWNGDEREYTRDTLEAMHRWLYKFCRAWDANPPE